MGKQLPELVDREKADHQRAAADQLAGWKDTKTIMVLSLLTLVFFYAMAEGMLRGRAPAQAQSSSSAACSFYSIDQSGSSSSTVLAAGRGKLAMAPTSALGDHEEEEGGCNNNYRTVGGEEDRLDYDDEVRRFRAYGTAAALYVAYGSYRGGGDTFAMVGLGAKSAYQFGKPGFECEWVDGGSASVPSTEASPAPDGGGAVSVTGRTLLPDLGYGRVYSVVVVNCTFPRPVGAAGQGGQLVLHASYGSGDDRPPPESILALREPPGSYDPAAFEPPFPYDFAYCRSPLYGDVNPDRVREWLAHHVRLMGPRALIVLHDAGGLGPAARAAIVPWRRLGVVRIQNIRRQSAFDGYYYNQFLVLNDCLHRTRFLARWTFFFDLDEYLYIDDPARTLLSVMESYATFTEVKFRQTFMVKGLCQPPNTTTTTEESRDTRWGIEKLVYRDMEDRLAHSSNKYAIQARNVFANGVHNAELGGMIGDWKEAEWQDLRFFHYHGTINIQGDLCKEYTQNMSLAHGNTIYQVEPGLALLAPSIKEFESEKIGSMINLSPTHIPSPSNNVTN